jgi:hypothetical protein
MKTVVSYLSGVPSTQKASHKTELLKKFALGVSRAGDRGIAHQGNTIIPADAAVIQGWVHEGSPNTPHLQLRKKVAEYQRKRGNHTIIVDSNLFNYGVGKDHPMQYLRYSLDGVFPTTGNYFWDNPDPTRWKQISRDLKITLKDWRPNGNHILICTQRNGGWSMKGLSVSQWLENTVDQIKKYTDRTIIVRGHPGDKSAKSYLRTKPGRYFVSSNPTILDDFKNAWATITYNSSPGVASSIEGIPAFITDPDPRISQAYDVGNYDLSKIESPELKDRRPWLEKLSMCHWNFAELESGAAWSHMRNYL